jgi:hypothetical protein
MQFLWCSAGYTLHGKARRSKLGMGKLDKQIHARKRSWMEHLQDAMRNRYQATLILSTKRKT